MEITVEIAKGDDDENLSGRRRISDEAGRANPRRRVRRDFDEPFIGHHLRRPGRLDVERTRLPHRAGLPELHLAMLLERHGPAGLSPDDHAWCSAIEAVVRNRNGIDCSVHVGNGRTAVPVIPRRAWPAA